MSGKDYVHPDIFYCGGMPLSSSRSVRDINHPLSGCAVFVIQKNHLSVIMRLFKPIYNERKGDFNGQKGEQFSTHQMDV